MGLLDTLAQAIGSKEAAPQLGDVAQSAPDDVLAKGLSAAFASDQNMYPSPPGVRSASSIALLTS